MYLPSEGAQRKAWYQVCCCRHQRAPCTLALTVSFVSHQILRLQPASPEPASGGDDPSDVHTGADESNTQAKPVERGQGFFDRDIVNIRAATWGPPDFLLDNVPSWDLWWRDPKESHESPRNGNSARTRTL